MLCTNLCKTKTKLFLPQLTCPPAGTGEVFTQGAALPLRRDHLLTVGEQLTLHLVADAHPVVTNTHATWRWFPDLVVPVDVLFERAAISFLLICNWRENRWFGKEALTNPSLSWQEILFTCWGVRTWRRCRGCRHTHGATLALDGHSFLTVAEVLTHHGFTHSGPHVAHTDPTRLRVPHVIVGVDFSIFCAGIFRNQKHTLSVCWDGVKLTNAPSRHSKEVQHLTLSCFLSKS